MLFLKTIVNIYNAHIDIDALFSPFYIHLREFKVNHQCIIYCFDSLVRLCGLYLYVCLFLVLLLTTTSCMNTSIMLCLSHEPADCTLFRAN